LTKENERDTQKTIKTTKVINFIGMEKGYWNYLFA
jgi:hypothetical protein